VTYNDPTIFVEYAVDTAAACHDLGLATIAVTAGYIQGSARHDLYEVMDAANVDLKGFTDSFYEKITGARLGPVLDTLGYLVHDTDVWVRSPLADPWSQRLDRSRSMCSAG
jgi:pyruvate formate lyase activating enzyme